MSYLDFIFGQILGSTVTTVQAETANIAIDEVPATCLLSKVARYH